MYLAHFQNILLQLNSISLVQFKNYDQRSFNFQSRIVGISGPNGIGKTNLLDAIYYLCFTKGYFTRSDTMNVKDGSQGFRIEGRLADGRNDYKVTCVLRETGKKEFSVNDQPYDKFAQHVGRFPCVFIAPDDIRMITEGSEERRRYIDAILSQLDPQYLQQLINYNKLLQQRNSYLKSLAENRMRDSGLLDVLDAQMVADGNYIFTKRASFLKDGVEKIKAFYQQISGTDEPVQLIYDSQLHATPFHQLLHAARPKDLQLQRTTTGPHKDDLQMLLNDSPFRNIGSQGQRKSLLFAMKLAEFSMLKENKGFAPLLLLDDVFEKLDENRMHNLLNWVCVQNEGQIFITDTHPERIRQHFDQLGVSFQLIGL